MLPESPSSHAPLRPPTLYRPRADIIRVRSTGDRMRCNRRRIGSFLAALLSVAVTTASAQDANITRPIAELEQLLAADPMVITDAKISRPNAKGDITLRAEVSFAGAPPFRVKLRKSEPGANSFNNVPRYDLAAYELQKLFLDPAEYVVPPTQLRMVALPEFAKYSPDVKRTFPGAEQVLAVVQYWLNDIQSIPDVYDAARFATDAEYARHIGQLNVFTYLIRHRDSNQGNFLLGKAVSGARVFSIDHGVAFASEDSDRGDVWKDMRVNHIPADTLQRLRGITLQALEERLAVLAEWRLEGGSYVRVPNGDNTRPARGVRRNGAELQMGLTASEIRDVHKRLTKLLERVDRGEIAAVPST